MTLRHMPGALLLLGRLRLSSLLQDILQARCLALGLTLG